MPWGALAFALGVWAAQQLAVLPEPTFIAVLAALCAALLVLARCRPRLALAGALLCGFAWAAGFAHWRLAEALPAAWEGRDVELTGVVAGLPQSFERGVRFTFAVENAGAPVPRRVSLSWYGEDLEWMPRAGERWRLVARLKRPHGNLNPHGFDWEGWLFERGIRATGYVRKSPPAERRDATPAGVDRLRAATRERILHALPDAPYAGVVVALAVGDQQAISLVYDKTIFRWA